MSYTRNQMVEVLTALWDMQQSPDCWCDSGDGAPIHSPACAFARDVSSRYKALASPETPMTDSSLSEIHGLVTKARSAVGVFRDAAQQGREIGYRERDLLVMNIHRALDQLLAELAKHDQQVDAIHTDDASVMGVMAERERVLQEQVESLKAENQQLTDDLRSEHVDGDALALEIVALQEENEQLKAELERAGQIRDAAVTLQDKLLEERRELRARAESAETQLSALRIEHEDVCTQLANASVTIGKQHDYVTALQQREAKLKALVETWREREKSAGPRYATALRNCAFELKEALAEDTNPS